jgi:hypothetical protein
MPLPPQPYCANLLQFLFLRDKHISLGVGADPFLSLVFCDKISCASEVLRVSAKIGNDGSILQEENKIFRRLVILLYIIFKLLNFGKTRRCRM